MLRIVRSLTPTASANASCVKPLAFLKDLTRLPNFVKSSTCHASLTVLCSHEQEKHFRLLEESMKDRWKDKRSKVVGNNPASGGDRSSRVSDGHGSSVAENVNLQHARKALGVQGVYELGRQSIARVLSLGHHSPLFAWAGA